MRTPKTPMFFMPSTPSTPAARSRATTIPTPVDPSTTPLSRRGRGRTGSALILSLVTIVMLVMLGAAYLQVARTDRRTAASVDTRTNQNNGSILRYIGGILAGDIPVEIGSDDPDSPEFYDYPWSNDAASFEPADQFAPTVVPGRRPNLAAGDLAAREPRAAGDLPDAAGIFVAEGGQFDDLWLSSTEPDASGFWPHVTNLQGVFLDLADTTAANDLVPGGTRLMPAQYLSTADNNFNSGDTFAVPARPMGLLTLAERGVFADADGDNIADSRWTWAPLPSDGGLAFVMAVRILDNSALMNINIASLLSSNNTVAGKEPRWLWPGELDLELPVADITVAAGFPGDLDPLDILGNTAPTGRNLANDAFQDRLDYWFSITDQELGNWSPIGSASEVDGGGGETIGNPTNTTNAYNARTEELELRWRNGLNRADDNVTDNAATSLESLAPNLFRDPNKHPSSGLMPGDAEPTFNESGYNTVASFFLEEPRKQMTVISGSANFAQTDLNDVGPDEIASVIEDVANNFIEAPMPINGTTPVLYQAGGWENPREFAAQTAAVLTDFRDANTLLTRVDNVYGMEYLPFISEVYLQGRYESVVTPDPAALPDPRDTVVWTIADIDATTVPRTTDAFAVAIELINPWPWEIEMPDVEVEILDDAGNRVRWGTLETLTGGRNTMSANEVIILTREDDEMTDPVVNDEIDAINMIANVTTPTPPATPIDLTMITMPDAAVDAWPIGNGAAGVLLSALTEDNARIAYQLFTVEELPETRTDQYTLGNGGATGEFGYRQVSAFGTGNGLAALTVRAADVPVELHTFAEPNLLPAGSDTSIKRGGPQPVTTGGAPLAAFAEVLKDKDSRDGALPPGNLPLDTRLTSVAPPNRGGSYNVGGTPDVTDEPWIIGNADRFYRTGDLLRAVVLGPRIDTTVTPNIVRTVADVWETYRVNTLAVTGNSRYSIRDAMFDLNDAALVEAGANDQRRMSHAAYLMGAFTNLESSAGLIPGRPNINTMPTRLLETIFPFATSPAVAVATLIDDARNNPTIQLGRPMGMRGIQTVSQLANPLTGPVIYNADPALSTNTQVIDFNEYEPEAAGPDLSHAIDGFTGDVEELTMAMNYLNQVASTRSDIFTAYVLVRAYPASDFSVMPTDEYRLIAVFDRSQVTGEGLPRIIAVKRFADP